MAYLLAKILLVAFVASIALAQVTPDPSWSDYKPKQCCPTSFSLFGNYCVQCTAPLFWDATSGKCSSCPADHIYNPTSKRCECTIPCDAPRTYNASTRQCECPADQKGTKRVWSDADKSCQCPANLPLWNGKYCVACPAGTNFDPKEHQCYHCPEGFVRDENTHTCTPGA